MTQAGNQQFTFAFQQLVDLSYLWSTAAHTNVTNATVAGAAPADEVRVLDANGTSVRKESPEESMQSRNRGSGWKSRLAIIRICGCSAPELCDGLRQQLDAPSSVCDTLSAVATSTQTRVLLWMVPLFTAQSSAH